MFGQAKYDVRELIFQVNKRFNIPIKRPVPHITLVGPIDTNQEAKLIADFISICNHTELVKYTIEGVEIFTGTKVVYLDVTPSRELIIFRRSLRDRLRTYCRLSEWDFVESFAFHSTIANNVHPTKLRTIQQSIKYSQIYNHMMLRATLLNNGRILHEYDFVLQKSLSRYEALDKTIQKQMWQQFGNNKSPKIYLISDMHLGHTNVIKYCDRSFINTSSMNNTLVRNWNRIISNNDKVYYLGDIAYGKGSDPVYWINKLNGDITFIRGNHDTTNKINFVDFTIIEASGLKFYLVHNPANVPHNWDGWIIHGHHHNNNIAEFPFILSLIHISEPTRRT